MSVEVIVVPNALEPRRTERHHAPELVPWLIEHFGRWPETARLYHRAGGAEYDVTPEVPADVPPLSELRGTVVVRIYPAGLDPLLGVGGIVLGAIKLLDWIIPDVPNVKTPAQRTRALAGGSPNNTLGKRSNEPRPDQRIPYIVGGVRSVPDLLGVPYTIYIDHKEVEIAYYCVGVGDYAVSDIRDGDTLISQIEGASAEVYGPGDAPTDGIHEPHTTIGDPIEDDVYIVYPVEAVNGQELRGFSDLTFWGSAWADGDTSDNDAIRNVFFHNGGAVGTISLPYNGTNIESATDITDRVEVGDELFVFWPNEHVPPGGVGTAPDLNTPVTSDAGEPIEVQALTVTAIDDTDTDINLVHLTVTIPTAQQAQWALLQTYFEDLQDPGGLFPYIGATFEFAQVTNLRDLYLGPFFIDFEHPNGTADFEIVCNFLAPRGLFMDDGVTTRGLNIEIQVIVTPADANGDPTGDSYTEQATLQGSATARGARALTMRIKPTGFTSTRCLVRARRLTNTPRRWRQVSNVEEDFFGADLSADPPRIAYFSGTVQDEIRWTHCYSMSKPGNISFGDVTTIHTKTVATTGALRVKERQLNCFAYRKIQTWDGDSFGGPLVANDRAENILFTIMKDSTIGDLDDANIDFEGIVAAFEQVRASVWSDADLATSFNFTFDDTDLSFEETLQAICQACFAVAYRLGTTIKVRPDIAGDDAVLLLNHRNITQGSQKITHTFGAPTENDSVEVGYVDPNDDRSTKVIVPKHGTRLKPRQVKVVGLRDAQQAYWHAYRALHKMRYQRQSVTLEALQEAESVGARERVLIADETRSGVQAGEVLAVVSDRVRTSQPVVLAGGVEYRIHFQKPDGTVYDRRVITAVSARELQIAGSLADIQTDPNEGLRTLYQVIANDEATPRAYLVSSGRPSTPMTHQLEAVNYSHLYHLADGLTTWVDFANGLSDLSPVQRPFVNTGGTITGGLWTGSSGDHFDATITTVPDSVLQSYTKLVWITATAAPTDSGLIRTVSGDDEAFEIAADNTLLAGHGAIDVSEDYTPYVGEEHMVAVTYDETTERMALSIDGVVVDEATVDPPAPGAVIRYLEGFEGDCRVVMRWGRALSDREVMEVFLRTRQ